MSLLFPGSVCRRMIHVDSAADCAGDCWKQPWRCGNAWGGGQALRLFMCRISECAGEVCPHRPGASRRWLGQVPLSTHGGPLQTRWMVSARVRGATAGRPRPLLATALDPVLGQLPTGDRTTLPPSPTPPLASWKLQVC